jgi:hypothetical protein
LLHRIIEFGNVGATHLFFIFFREYIMDIKMDGS